MHRLGRVALAMLALHLAPAWAQESADPVAPPSVPAPSPPPSAPPVAARPDAQELPLERRLMALDHLMTDIRASRSSFRLWGGVSALALGVALIPPGAILLKRDSGVESGLFLGAGIGAALAGALTLTLASDPMEQLADAYQLEKEAGMGPEQLVLSIEEEWAKEARRAADRRAMFGPVLAGLSAVAVGAGIVTAFVEPSGETNSSRDLRVTAGAMVALFGAAGAVGAFRLIFVPDDVEEKWSIYRETRGLQSSLGFAPLPGGGGALSWAGTF